MHIKTGDTVVLLTGKYEYKYDDNKNVITHKVIAVSPKENKVIVEGVNMIHKHVKPRRQGESGGIVDAEGAIYASNVALVCPKCGKAARVMHKVDFAEVNGKQKRIVTRLAAHKACGYPEIK